MDITRDDQSDMGTATLSWESEIRLGCSRAWIAKQTDMTNATDAHALTTR